MSAPDHSHEAAAAEAEPPDDFEVQLRKLIKDFGNLVTDTLVTISGRAPKEPPPRRHVGEWFKSLPRRLFSTDNYKAVIAFTFIFLVVSFFTAFFYFVRPPSGSFDTTSLKLPPSSVTCPAATAKPPVKVSPAAGAGAVMNILIGRNGDREVGQTEPLTILKGSLCAGSILPMTPTTFTRSDGSTLQASQLLSWAQVGDNGTNVTVSVVVAPHHGPPPGAGVYSGAVSLDTSMAEGGKVPVRVHIQYQNIKLVWAFSALAAFGGFIWAWLLHTATGGMSKKGYFFRPFALCAAVILAAAIPILNVQVLSKPDWEGSSSQYIGLATLVGAAAIAATPTLRALVLPRNLGDGD